jgi:hypothetical protein
MRRHKRHYFEPTDNPDITRVVVVWRNLKPKSRIRRLMWIAHHLKFND